MGVAISPIQIDSRVSDFIGKPIGYLGEGGTSPSGMLGGPGDRIAENAVLNMARRDIAPGWRDGGGPALSVDRAWNVAQATPRYIAIRRDPAGQRFEGDPLERHVSQVAGPWPCTPPPPWDPPGNQSALLPQ